MLFAPFKLEKENKKEKFINFISYNFEKLLTGPKSIKFIRFISL